MLRTGLRAVTLSMTLGFGLACVAGGTGVAHAKTITFGSIGARQTFKVPRGVKRLHVTAIGGRGGIGSNTNVAGGLGGLAAADLQVKPAGLLVLNVGGNGANGGISAIFQGGAGGFNGGGAGGSSTAMFGKGGGAGGGAS